MGAHGPPKVTAPAQLPGMSKPSTLASGATEDKGLDLAELVSQGNKRIVGRAKEKRWDQLDILWVLLAGKRDCILSVVKHKMWQKVEGLWQGLAGWILYF